MGMSKELLLDAIEQVGDVAANAAKHGELLGLGKVHASSHFLASSESQAGLYICLLLLALGTSAHRLGQRSSNRTNGMVRESRFQSRTEPLKSQAL